MDLPSTAYATSADGTSIAYQVTGSGDVDLLFMAPGGSHLDLRWGDRGYAALLTRLGRFSRLISVDKRGSGLSDRDVGLPTPEQEVEDLTAVLDAAGCDQAYVMGTVDSAASGVIFAASRPGRTLGVIAFSAFARALEAPDYPIGFTREAADAITGLLASNYGTASMAALVAPSRHGDEEFARWLAAYHRASASPRAYAAWLRNVYEIDIRRVLPLVQAPVLVLRRRDAALPGDLSRYLAEHLPHGCYRELPGADTLMFTGDIDALVAEVEEFVTGRRQEIDADRVLATILFTDIVNSTRHVVAAGDAAWRRLLDEHDAIVANEALNHRGRVVKTTGDGALAIFDGPAQGVRCAAAIRRALARIGLQVRAGLHTGETELRGDDVGGVAVHIAARVAAHAGAGEIVVSRTIVDLVYGSGLAFEARGAEELKGIPGTWELYLVIDT